MMRSTRFHISIKISMGLSVRLRQKTIAIIMICTLLDQSRWITSGKSIESLARNSSLSSSNLPSPSVSPAVISGWKTLHSFSCQATRPASILLLVKLTWTHYQSTAIRSTPKGSALIWRGQTYIQPKTTFETLLQKTSTNIWPKAQSTVESLPRQPTIKWRNDITSMCWTRPKEGDWTRNQVCRAESRTLPFKAARKGSIHGWTISKRVGLRAATLIGEDKDMEAIKIMGPIRKDRKGRWPRIG